MKPIGGTQYLGVAKETGSLQAQGQFQTRAAVAELAVFSSATKALFTRVGPFVSSLTSPSDISLWQQKTGLVLGVLLEHLVLTCLSLHISKVFDSYILILAIPDTLFLSKHVRGFIARDKLSKKFHNKEPDLANRLVYTPVP